MAPLGILEPRPARKATETLFQSVSALVGALDQDRVGSLLHPKASQFSVSANLCDALMKMQSDAESGSVELSVSWASLLPKPGSGGRQLFLPVATFILAGLGHSPSVHRRAVCRQAEAALTPCQPEATA
jgi:hypothetical protein